MKSKPQADIFVIGNKSWEIAPLIAILQHFDAIPDTLQNVGGVMGCQTSVFVPRASLTCLRKTVAIWCVQDLMDPGVSSSQTKEKHRVLSQLVKVYDAPLAVIAVGTAAFPSGDARNGCISLASRYFIHDPFPSDSDTHWKPPRPDEVISSPLDAHLDQMVAEIRAHVEPRILRPPLLPADPPTLVSRLGGVSIGVVNVTDPKLYAKADQSALDSFSKQAKGTAVSVETTHGVICETMNAPFLAVSGIANGVGKFETEVVPRKYAQNFAAAHNAGICVAWLLPQIARLLD